MRLPFAPIDRSRHRCYLLLPVICLLAAGCQPPERKLLIGCWNLATADDLSERLNSSERETGPERAANVVAAPNQQPQPLDARPASSESRMQLCFAADGALSTATQVGAVAPQPKFGSWRMLQFDSQRQTMLIECTLNGQTTETSIHFLSEEMIELVPPNLAGLTLKLKFARASVTDRAPNSSP